MALSRRSFVAIFVVLLGSAMGALVIAISPHVVKSLVYAIHSGEAQAAREQLSQGVDLSQAFQAVAKSLRPSVVSIDSVRHFSANLQPRRGQPRGLPDDLNQFYDQNPFPRGFPFPTPKGRQEEHGEGTGVIVSDDGYVLTANHVVRGADEWFVKLSSGRSVRASVVGTDEKTDLAVVKIDVPDLVPAELGDSDKVEVGEWVLAIGSPFGLDQTVTAGIISAKKRADVGITDYEDFMQTDAAINPGNSGGPLVDLHGKVIGINTAIASENGGNMGVGFAIPSNMARTVMESIIKEGRVERGWLGAGIQDLSEELAQSFGFEGKEGVLIGEVLPDTPAEQSGLRAGDIVVKYNGKAVSTASEFRNKVAATPANTEVELLVFRDGKTETLKATIGRLEGQVAALRNTRPSAAPGLGLTVKTLTPEIAEELGLDRRQTGAVVTDVASGSLADKAGIRVEDVITSVAGAAINTDADFRDAVKKQDLKRGFRVQLRRNGRQIFIFIQSK
jgi:serine protease Do